MENTTEKIANEELEAAKSKGRCGKSKKVPTCPKCNKSDQVVERVMSTSVTQWRCTRCNEAFN